MPSQRTVSVAEAARLTGLSKAAINARVDNGELRAIRRAGLRRISIDELAESGLLGGTGGDERAADRHPLVPELLDRIERQSAEIARLRFELGMARRRAETERRRRRARRP